MDRDKARIPDGRVFEISNIKADTQYLRAGYTYVKGDGVLSDTGRIVLFELKPQDTRDPSFIARWDGGNRAVPRKIQYAVDVDIEGVSNAAKRNFRKGNAGYCGHHPKRVNPDENKYDVRITVPNGLVFNATISFNRHHTLAPTATTPSSVNLSTTTTRSGFLAKLKSAIMRLFK